MGVSGGGAARNTHNPLLSQTEVIRDIIYLNRSSYVSERNWTQELKSDRYSLLFIIDVKYPKSISFEMIQVTCSEITSQYIKMTMNSSRLQRDFFTQNTLLVARELLGKRLVRLDNGQRLAGIIIETEAYRGEEDLACHAKVGRTARTQVMYGPPGYTYVYFTYGMHWLLNIVTEEEDYPAAVLIRAIVPTEGGDVIASRRIGQPPHRWTDGPAKICQALSIDGAHNARDLCAKGAEIFVEQGLSVPEENVSTTPRVGLNTVPEPWKSVQWRFGVDILNVESAGKADWQYIEHEFCKCQEET